MGGTPGSGEDRGGILGLLGLALYLGQSGPRVERHSATGAVTSTEPVQVETFLRLNLDPRSQIVIQNPAAASQLIPETAEA